jgi:hypothetical protein
MRSLVTRLSLAFTVPVALVWVLDFSAPVVTIDGVELSRGAYAEYLIALNGKSPLENLVHLRLLEDEARDLDPDGSQITTALEETWAQEEQLMAQRTRGDRDALERDLVTLGFTLPEYRERFQLFKRPELLEDLIIRATRTVQEADLQLAFEQEFGEGGVKVEVRHLMMNRAQLKAGLIKTGTPANTLDNDTLDQMIATQMATLKAQIQAGADFEALARAESYDLSAKQNGGLIPGYNYKHYGPAFADAVRAADVGELVGPLASQAAVHLLRVESRVVTTLEEARPALTAMLLAAPVEFPERAALRRRLLSEHQVVYLD